MESTYYKRHDGNHEEWDVVDNGRPLFTCKEEDSADLAVGELNRLHDDLADAQFFVGVWKVRTEKLKAENGRLRQQVEELQATLKQHTVTFDSE